MLRAVTGTFFWLFLSAAMLATAGPVDEVERIEGAFTEFDVEYEGETIVAVHFHVGDRRVVATDDTQISGGDPVGPAVLLSLPAFVELAEMRELSGVVEGTSGEGVLFARSVFIDPFDPPGEPTVLSGPFTDFELRFDGDELVGVQFQVENQLTVASQDTRIVLQRGDRGPMELRLAQFAELAEEHELSGEVSGLVDDGVLHARRIKVDAVEPDPEPVVLEGPFSEFEPVPGEDGLRAVSFVVEGRPVLATHDTRIVLTAPTLSANDGNQLTLREFLALGLEADIAGRVEGQVQEETVVARHIRVRRIDRPGDRIEIEGTLQECDLTSARTVISVQLTRSDRIVDVVLSDETRLFFLSRDEDPITIEDLNRLCDGELVVRVFARGELVPTATNDAVHILASLVVFEYVDAAVRGRFQGGEVSNEQVVIAIGDVKVLVDGETNIEFGDRELNLAEFAELVEGNEVYLAKAGGWLRKDGALQARRLALREAEPPAVEIEGRLFACEPGEPTVVMIERADLLILAHVDEQTRLAEKRGDALAAISLDEFVDKCNADEVYDIYGAGPHADPLIFDRAVISQVRVRHRGAFQGGEVTPDEVLIELSGLKVRVTPETKLSAHDDEPLDFDTFVALVEAGERHWAKLRGVLLKDDSVRALQLRLRERPNVQVHTPVDGEGMVNGNGAPGIDVDVFDAAGQLLGSAEIGVTGELRLSTQRNLLLGETIVPVALGVAEEAAPAATGMLFSGGFE